MPPRVQTAPREDPRSQHYHLQKHKVGIEENLHGSYAYENDEVGDFTGLAAHSGAAALQASHPEGRKHMTEHYSDGAAVDAAIHGDAGPARAPPKKGSMHGAAGMRTGTSKSQMSPYLNEKVKRRDHRASLGQESTLDQVLYGRSTSPSHKAKHGGLTSLHPASHNAAGKAVKETEIRPDFSPRNYYGRRRDLKVRDAGSGDLIFSDKGAARRHNSHQITTGTGTEEEMEIGAGFWLHGQDYSDAAGTKSHELEHVNTQLNDARFLRQLKQAEEADRRKQTEGAAGASSAEIGSSCSTATFFTGDAAPKDNTMYADFAASKKVFADSRKKQTIPQIGRASCRERV